MRRLAEICIRRPVFATVLILSLVVVGLVAYFTLGVDRFPNVDFPLVDGHHAAGRRRPRGDGDRGHRQDRGGGQHDQRHRPADLDLVRGHLASSRSGSTWRRTATWPRRRCATRSTRCSAELPARPIRRSCRSSSPTPRRSSPSRSPARLRSARSPSSPTRCSSDSSSRRLGVGQVRIIGGRPRQINVIADTGEARRPGPHRRRRGAGAADAERADPGRPGRAGAARPHPAHLRPRRRPRGVRRHLRSRRARATRCACATWPGSRTAWPRPRRSPAWTASPPWCSRCASSRAPTPSRSSTRSRSAWISCAAQLPKGWSMNIVRDQSDYIVAAVDAVQEHLVLGALFAAGHRVPLPADVPPDDHRGGGDPHLAHRHLRGDELHGLHPQHHHPAGARPGGGHRDRRRGGGAGEHLPPHGGEEG